MTHLMSLADAAAAAHVSTHTIERFAEAGCLTPHREGTALKVASDEVAALFGIVIADLQPKSETTTTESTDSVSPAAVTITESKTETSTEGSAGSPFPSSATVNSASGSSTTAAADANAASERLIKAYELLIARRDAEIEDLKGEREWLRRRIERLEEKQERDQILLLSETQVVRRLLSERDTYRSPIKAFLSWCGLSTPGDEQQSSIRQLQQQSYQGTTTAKSSETSKAA